MDSFVAISMNHPVVHRLLGRYTGSYAPISFDSSCGERAHCGTMPVNGAIREICHCDPKTRAPDNRSLSRHLPLLALLSCVDLLAFSLLQVHAQRTDPIVSDEMQLLKEEETVSVATQYEQ